MAVQQVHNLDTANGRRNIRRQRLPCSRGLLAEDKELASKSRIAGAKATGVRLATRIEGSSERSTDAQGCAKLRKIVRIHMPTVYASTHRRGSSTATRTAVEKRDPEAHALMKIER